MKKKTSGTFVKNDNGWTIDTKVKIDGVWKHFKKSGYKSLSEAKADYGRAEAEFIRKVTTKHEVKLFGDLLREYKRKRERTINLTTLQNDDYVIGKFMPWETMLIRDCLERDFIRKWYNDIRDDESVSDKRASVIVTRIRDLLKFAWERKYIDSETYQDCSNEIYSVRYDKSVEKERVIWTRNEEKAFFEAIDDKKDYVMFKCFFSLGARLGEFLGMQRKSINLDKKRAIIGQQVIYNGKGQFTLTETLKTNESYRTVLLSDSTVALLREYFNEMRFLDNDFVWFGKHMEEPIGRSTFRRKLKAYCQKAGVRECNPHAARHMMATKLCSAANSMDEIEICAKMMGHSPQMFMNIYAKHINEDTEKSLIDKIS